MLTDCPLLVDTTARKLLPLVPRPQAALHWDCSCTCGAPDDSRCGLGTATRQMALKRYCKTLLLLLFHVLDGVLALSGKARFLFTALGKLRAGL